MLAPDEMKRVHPLGKSPVIEDDGRTFAETGLIVEYLVERYGPDLAPSRDSDLHWRYRYWLHYAEGSAMPPLLLKLIVDRLGILAFPARKFVKSQVKLHLDYLEAELGGGPWFLGERFSAADIMLSFPLEAARVRGGLDSDAAESVRLCRARPRSSGLSTRARKGRSLPIRGMSRCPRGARERGFAAPRRAMPHRWRRKQAAAIYSTSSTASASPCRTPSAPAPLP